MLNYPGETWQSYVETMDGIDSTIIAGEGGQSHRFDFYEYAFFPGNAVFQSIQSLRDKCGSEVCDPEWYKRTTGNMLEMSRCRVPSKALIDHVGQSQIHSYYIERVEKINERCRPTARSFLYETGGSSNVCDLGTRRTGGITFIRGLAMPMSAQCSNSLSSWPACMMLWRASG
jgi:hypothetical protein